MTTKALHTAAITAVAAYVDAVLRTDEPGDDELERAELLAVLARHAYGHCYQAASRANVEALRRVRWPVALDVGGTP